MLPASLTVDGLKVRIDKKLSNDDGLLAEFLEAALTAAQRPSPLGCGRLLSPDPGPELDEEGNDTSSPVARTIRIRGRHVMVPDAREITGVTVDGVTVAEDAGYVPMERDGHIVRLTLDRECLPGTGYWDEGWWRGGGVPDRRPRRHTVVVTGRFGFADLPQDLVEGIYTLAARGWYEREAQYADQVAIAEGTPIQTYFRQLPPRTRLAFEALTLPRGIGGLS